MGLYDTYLALRYRRHDGAPPGHIALAITERDLLDSEGYETLEDILAWADQYGAERVTVAVSVLDDAVIPTLERTLDQIQSPQPMAIRTPTSPESATTPIQILIGLGGKQEFATAVRELAQEVAVENLTPDAIDEGAIADQLLFAEEPDLMIKTGAERLSDFAIWQSVYSELYFTDINWQNMRKRDFLRALLDFKQRQRRFGQ